MAKSKTRKRAKSRNAGGIAWGGSAATGTGRINLILAAVAAAVLIGGAAYWWMGRTAQNEFLALAAEGRPALERVASFPNLGRTHLSPGEHYSYRTSTPTSGPHDPFPTEPGVYRSPQPPTKLVHSLEHGMVVIYYDRPSPQVMDQLEAWAEIYPGAWDGVVVTRLSGLGDDIVATAWRKKLALAPFDPAAAAAFIDAYRGRGPENKVR